MSLNEESNFTINMDSTVVTRGAGYFMSPSIALFRNLSSTDGKEKIFLRLYFWHHTINQNRGIVFHWSDRINVAHAAYVNRQLIWLCWDIFTSSGTWRAWYARCSEQFDPKHAHFDLLPRLFSPGCKERGRSQHLFSLCFRMVTLIGSYSYFHMLSEQ